MINKKNVLGKVPDEIGVKDAIHAAIVAVRAGEAIEPGSQCILNEFNEAVVAEKKGVGVADPFWPHPYIHTGQIFWLILGQHEVPNVQHHWEHPTVSFAPPTRPIKLNSTLKSIADNFQITYEQLMKACQEVINDGKAVQYPGPLSEDDFDAAIDDSFMWDLWDEWSNETGHEFPNHGSECCPEYEHPDNLFYYPQGYRK